MDKWKSLLTVRRLAIIGIASNFFLVLLLLRDNSPSGRNNFVYGITIFLWLGLPFYGALLLQYYSRRWNLRKIKAYFPQILVGGILLNEIFNLWCFYELLGRSPGFFPLLLLGAPILYLAYLLIASSGSYLYCVIKPKFASR